MVRLYSGLQAGMEGVIHAVCELFDLHNDDSWGVCLLMQEMLLIYVVDHVVTLWNARVLWLHCSCFLFNSYQGYAKLFIQESDLLKKV